jgi:broad specificity phosphatase PhoE
MSNLVLVRHGRGGPLGGFYDKLSPSGEEQSRALGRFWAKHRVSFDEIYTGTLARQIDTARLAGEECRAAGLEWPEPQVIEGLNEYEADSVLQHLLPQLAEKHEPIRRLKEVYESTQTEADRYRNFQRMFEAVMRYWVSGEYEGNGCEAWRSFRDRVRGSVKEITSKGKSNRRVAVFTSGGPIGVCVQSVLGAPDEMAIQLNWRVRNSSLTEFIFSGADRMTLEWFNALPHLNDPQLWTFR